MRKRRIEVEKQLTHRVHARITKEKFEELSAMLSRSRGIHSLSELVRKIMEHEKITLVTYDVTQDKLLEELAMIRKELNAIGININQVTRRLNNEEFPQALMAQASEILKFFQIADLKISEIMTLISKIPEQWSQGS